MVISKKTSRVIIVFQLVVILFLSGVCFFQWKATKILTEKCQSPNRYGVSPMQKQSTESGDLTEINPPTAIDLDPKQLEQYYQVYKNNFVLYLRKALDAYLANDSSGVNISMAAVQEDRRDGIITGLDAFDKNYYKSKFIVLTINDSIAGGKDIQIIFQDKPDRIFYVWVYQLADESYELRAFNSKEYFEERR